ncbi:MAG: aminodeoxychorismate/anthranilate synthase component II [bacterium]
MQTLIIDNYDSFTYNLYQYVGELGGRPVVFRNDEINISDIKKLKPTHIILSPGPGTPEKRSDFGVCEDVILEFKKIPPSPPLRKGGVIPTLGVCLGHQGIIHYLGGKIIHAPKVMHGKSDLIFHDKKSLFNGLKSPLKGMRYHSLVGDINSLPDDLEITALTKDGTVMAVAHKTLPLFGIQFHPESVGTDGGKKILRNFLKT